jgi:hypothetical protein
MTLRPAAVAAIGIALAASLAAQAPVRPVGDAAPDPLAQAALAALDYYLETWNSRDPDRWATSLHFPHVRPGPGAFELSDTPAQYASRVDFKQTLATGWHHSEWTTRRVLHVSPDKVHAAGSWRRYTADDKPLVGSDITYIVTRQDGRWGVLSRFAAGPSGLTGADAAAAAKQARQALDDYVAALNRHDEKALANALHYPYVRIAGRELELVRTPADFASSSEPGRLRTWFATRLDRVEAVQTSANGVNLAVTYSRLERGGKAMSSYDAVFLAVRRDGVWKIQAVSTMGS